MKRNQLVALGLLICTAAIALTTGCGGGEATPPPHNEGTNTNRAVNAIPGGTPTEQKFERTHSSANTASSPR